MSSRAALQTLGLRRFGLPFLVLSGGRLIALLVQALVLGLLARALGVSAFGVHSTALAVGYLTMTLLDFGLSARALRVGAESDPRIARQLLLIRLASLLGLIPVGFGALGWIGALQGQDALVIATLAFLAGDVCGELSASLLLGRLQRGQAMAWVLVRRVGGLIPLLFSLSFGAAMASLWLAGAVGVGQACFLAQRLPGNGQSMRSVVLGSMRYWGTSIASSLQRCDVLLVGALGGKLLAGQYGAATRIATPLNAVTGVLLQFGVPEVAHVEGRERRQAFRTLWLGVLCWSAALLVLAIFAQPFTRIVLGGEFVSAWPLVMAATVSAAMSAVAQVALAWHLANGIPPILAPLMTSLVGLGLLCLGVATAVFGVWGAAGGLMCGNLLVMIALVAFPRRAS